MPLSPVLPVVLAPSVKRRRSRARVMLAGTTTAALRSPWGRIRLSWRPSLTSSARSWARNRVFNAVQRLEAIENEAGDLPGYYETLDQGHALLDQFARILQG